MTISTITLVAIVICTTLPLCILAYWHGRERHQRALNEYQRQQNEDYVRWLMEPYIAPLAAARKPQEIERR